MTREERKVLVDALYNRCANGEISVNQREQLILKINSMHTVTESVDTSVGEIQEPVQESRNLTPTQKYKMFKESVYEKCAKGEITVETREELLLKARDMFSASI